MEKRPAVLFLATKLGPGGVATHMVTLAQGLKARGWDVALASRGRVGDHPHGPEWFEAQGVSHHRVPFPLAFSDLRSALRSARELERVVCSTQPSLLHVHWRSTSPCARWIQLRYGTPFLSTLHVDSTPCGLRHRLISFWGERVIAISRETSHYLTHRFGVPAERVRTVYYGRDPDYFRPATPAEKDLACRELGVNRSGLVISLIGSDCRRKGHDVLMGALNLLKEWGIFASVLFAGDPREEREIHRLAAEQGVSERVRFLGYRDSRTVLWASDVFALPSRKEGLPIAVLEAMLCAVVPIRTPAAGASDQIVDAKTGFIVPFDDSYRLAGRLRLLSEDAGLRQKMSQAAFQAAREKFTAERMVQDTIQVYEEVLGNGS